MWKEIQKIQLPEGERLELQPSEGFIPEIKTDPVGELRKMESELRQSALVRLLTSDLTDWNELRELARDLNVMPIGGGKKEHFVKALKLYRDENTPN
jgi:predicted DNA-binding antitoxin AbrB/MazE fold protein